MTTVSFLLMCAAAAAAQTDSTPPAAAPSAGNGATAAAPATAAVIPSDYRLVPGDKLRVEVYKDTQLSQSVQVRPDGKITLPLANDVEAVGKTPIELRNAIVESLKPYVSNPTVTVIVVETTPGVIYVMGEVNSAGPQPLTRPVDVVQALAMAGGFKDFAKTKNIMVRRNGKVIRFNYNDAVRGNAQPLIIQPGDTIIVP